MRARGGRAAPAAPELASATFYHIQYSSATTLRSTMWLRGQAMWNFAGMCGTTTCILHVEGAFAATPGCKDANVGTENVISLCLPGTPYYSYWVAAQSLYTLVSRNESVKCLGGDRTEKPYCQCKK